MAVDQPLNNALMKEDLRYQDIDVLSLDVMEKAYQQEQEEHLDTEDIR